MRLSYKAWVPTVNGRLSFRVIGETTYPSRPQYSNLRIGKHQYVVVRQVRNTSDVLFNRLLSKLFGLEGDFEYYFVARARVDQRSPDARLVGKLYLFRTLSEHRRKLKEEIGTLFDDYRALERSPFDVEELKRCYINTHQLLANSAEVTSNLVLKRNGVLSISRVCWHDHELYERSAEHATDVHLDINGEIADQLYFFVRDIAHQHQHHSPDADTIITTQESLGTEKLWYRNVLYSLYFHIINAKRRSAGSEQARALGVLAYIRSFEEIAKSEGCDLPIFYRLSAKESIEASRGYLDWEETRKRTRSDRTRTVMFSLAGLAVGMIGFVAGFADDKVPADPHLVEMANLLKQNFWTVLIPPLLAVMYWLSAWVTRIPIGIDVWRDATRAALVSRFIALGMIAAVVIALMFFLADLVLNILLALAR